MSMLTTKGDVGRSGVLASMIPAHHDKEGNRQGRVLALTVVGLLLAILVASSLRLEDSLAPRTGDVLTFSPTKDIVGELQAAITADRAGDPHDARCTLDPAVMERSGGSLVIEATQFDPSLEYRVHWAGAHTSDAGSDCGTSAELELTPAMITTLAMAADHFGQERVAPILPNFSVQ